MMTDTKTQKYLFGNTVDMKIVEDSVNNLLDQLKDIGSTQKLIIDIRKDDRNLTLDQIVNDVDKEYQSNRIAVDMLRITRIKDRLVIVGIKL